MDEITLQWIQISKVLAIAVYVGLYGFGGMRGKWKRRILGALWMTLAICGYALLSHTFSYWYLLSFLLYFGASSLGYGSETLREALSRRTLQGLAFSCVALPIVILTGNWLGFALHSIFCLSSCIILGGFNILPSARAEESLIALSVSAVPLFLI